MATETDTGGTAAATAAQAAADRLLGVFGPVVASRGGPLWLQLGGDPAGPGWTETGGPQGLLGRRVDPRYWGAAVVAGGRLVALRGGTGPADTDRDGRGLRMACVVGRDGTVGWSTDLLRPGPLARPPEQGRVLDVLLRSLELPTAPPPCPFARLEVTIWLMALIDAGRVSGGRPIDWDEAKALRPGRPGFGGADAGGSWERYRAGIASGAGGPVDADLAAWMDEGMLSRWVLAALPDLELVLAVATRVLDAGAAHRLALLVDAACSSVGVSTSRAPQP